MGWTVPRVGALQATDVVIPNVEPEPAVQHTPISITLWLLPLSLPSPVPIPLHSRVSGSSLRPSDFRRRYNIFETSLAVS